MLQQTQVDTVVPFFERFMERFPSVEDLARAPEDEVMSLWTGLGYYSRARNLHKAAKVVAKNGEFPLKINGLRELPGVGEYMAGAIASIALGLDEATVDGNIARVMARLHADAGPRAKMWDYARAHLPTGRAGDYNQALMDLGATICKPRQARCEACPISTHCVAFREGEVERYPPPKKSRRVPVQAMEAHWFEREGKVLLFRRPSSGLWGGLWELPGVRSSGNRWTAGEREEAWQSTYGCGIGQGRVVLKQRHVLSHRVFEYRLIRGEGVVPSSSADHEELRWFSRAEVDQVGMSALTKLSIDTMWP